MRDLNLRHLKLVEWFNQFEKDNGRCATYKEAAKACGFKSKSNVSFVVDKAVALGITVKAHRQTGNGGMFVMDEFKALSTISKMFEKWTTKIALRIWLI